MAGERVPDSAERRGATPRPVPRDASRRARTRSPRIVALTDLVGPRSALARELTSAYWHEIETVTNHLASCTNRGGIHAARIAYSIRKTVASDLKHAQQLAMRIRRLHATAPGRDDFVSRQPCLRPPAEPLDNVSVLAELIDAQAAAVNWYGRIVAAAPEAHDWVTRDLANRIMRDKEIHRQSLENVLATERQS